MNAFTYASPTDLPSVLGLLGSSAGPTEILAGGTDLLALMKDDVVMPSQLVNIKKVAGLQTVSVDKKRGLHAGCLMKLDDLATNAQVGKLYPALATALGDAASPQIRNMATIGGNLCQRPRCWYFRNGYGLLALDANGKSLVLQGDNRYHAVLGNSGPAYFVSLRQSRRFDCVGCDDRHRRCEGPAVNSLGIFLRYSADSGTART